MAIRLDDRSPGFRADFDALVERRREETADVRVAVSEIIEAVRRRGDGALVELTARLDAFEVDDAADLAIAPEERRRLVAACSPEDVQALRVAADRIRAFHELQRPRDIETYDGLGVRLGLRWTAIDSVGLYVPGGTAAYPSSVLMNAVPARVAGCRRIVMTVPTPGGKLNPLVVAAAELAGVDEIYRIGGAQAVAALAYGTATIAPVDKIMGPGNAYVAEAKRQVFGRVGIDMIAGPSEIVVIADARQRADWVASDLLSQAEHDPRAQAVLITDDAGFAERVESEVERQLARLPRSAIAGASWQEEGTVIIVRRLGDAADLVNALAPEHLELMVEEPAPLLDAIRNAGAIFIGPWTPEVMGDYVGGPNHVLPTGRTARFASGLGVTDFLKRTTLLGFDRRSFRELAPVAERLARAEALDAHAAAVECRREGGS